MKSPCLKCHKLFADKKDDECMYCEKRFKYVQFLESNIFIDVVEEKE